MVLVKITNFDERHVQIKIDDKIVLMRNEDSFLNASQILTLANKNSSDSEHLLQLIKQIIKIEVLPSIVGTASSCSWVNFKHERILCKHLRLKQKLQSLIDHELKLQRDNYSRSMEHVNNHPTKI